MNEEYLSKLIKEKRKEFKMDQKELALMSGVSLATIRAIEQGTSSVNLRTLSKILKLFNLRLTVEKDR